MEGVSIMSRVSISCLALAFVAACNPGPAGTPATAVIEPDEVAPAPEVRLIVPTADMVAAARTGDPALMAKAALATGTCQAPSTCPSEFGACTGFSAASECDFSCGTPLCRCPRFEPDCVPTPRGKTTLESFRVCFNPAGDQCVEWRQTFSFFCDC
jgi:hypothetical protein